MGHVAHDWWVKHSNLVENTFYETFESTKLAKYHFLHDHFLKKYVTSHPRKSSEN